MTRPLPLAGLILRTFAWLPPCFAAWYLAAPVLTTVVAAFARLFVAFFNARLIAATELPQHGLVFVTTLQVRQAQGPAGVLAVEVDPLLYTYGLALFLALALAARTRWWRVLAGVAILLPFQGWGIAFDFLAQLGAKLGPEVAADAGLLGAREFIALAYQLGNLVFPSVVPVVLWVAVNRAYVEGLLPRSALPPAGPRGAA